MMNDFQACRHIRKAQTILMGAKLYLLKKPIDRDRYFARCILDVCTGMVVGKYPPDFMDGYLIGLFKAAGERDV